MAILTLRSSKGAPLTSTELDNNFSNLNLDIASRVSSDPVLLKQAITNIDGVGSGIDADLVRGLASSAINTPSTVVTRDSSGNFSGNTITANLFSGAVSGTVTNGVVTTGSYADPAWITSLSPTKVGLDTKSALFNNPSFTGTTTATRLTAGGRSLVGQSIIDLSALDAATYYPVTIALSPNRISTMRIEVALNSGTVPSWSTHPQGFALFIEWTAYGNGWGTFYGVQRTIKGYAEAWTTGTIVGGITQMTTSNNEVIYLRGGGKYFFSADNDLTPVIQTASYTINGMTVAPSTTIINSPTSTATSLLSAGSLTLTSSLTLPTGTTTTLDAVTTGNIVAAALSVNSISANVINTGTQINAQGLQTSSLVTSTGGLGGIMVQAPTPSTTNAAFMCFHRPGIYASYFGIDTDNYFAVGGWSAGAALANFKANSVLSKNTAKAWAYLVNNVIVSSHNITSVSKPSAGRYLFTMTNPTADTNYAVFLQGAGQYVTTASHNVGFIDSPTGSGGTYVHSTTQFQIAFWPVTNSATPTDQTYVSVAIFGN